jgi:hypothetical protein
MAIGGNSALLAGLLAVKRRRQAVLNQELSLAHDFC